jgi:hypothetical protein
LGHADGGRDIRLSEVPSAAHDADLATEFAGETVGSRWLEGPDVGHGQDIPSSGSLPITRARLGEHARTLRRQI